MSLISGQFQNNFCVFDVMYICLTTSGAPIVDLTVVSCAPFTFGKSAKTAPPNSGLKCFNNAIRTGGFFTPSAMRGLIINSVT